MSKDTVRLSNPADFIAIVPYLLGYHPSPPSIVAMAFDAEPTRLLGVVRFDLPNDSAETPQLAERLGKLLRRNGCHGVFLIGYGPGALVTPVVDAITSRLDGIHLVDAVRAEDNRYWSYCCADPGCCPPDGVPYEIAESRAAVSAVLAGLVARPDRETFARTLDPATGEDRELVTAATQTACAHAREMLKSANGTYWYREGLDRVAEAFETERLTADQVAWLGVLLTGIFVRDGAMTFIGRYDDEAHISLWTDVTRRVDPAFAAAPAALLAFVAYRSGNGALARIAVERSLTADPGYRFALLTACALDHGVPPETAASMDCAGLADDIAAKVEEFPHIARPIIPEGW
ncbi:DUF4192 domain-containing protein [Nonomuraea sp. NPDC049152]|uniref:DUF4192 domain-containing protein n=1 Tax=Nonomuraea sp. NPDC049152 TaxID=3154350 RepID=UPI0033E308EA